MVSPRARQWSTRAIFFLAGAILAAWAPLVPYAKTRLQLDERALGLLLLCAGLGSIIAMPFAGTLAGRYGYRAIIVATTLIACCVLPVLAVAGQTAWIAIALALFGAALGSLDVTMNLQAVVVERESGKAMMSGFHGLWSVGGIVGASCMSLLISAGVPLLTSAIVLSTAAALLTAFCAAYLINARSPLQPGSVVALPHGAVLVLGIFCFVLFMAEGSVLDWSAVFLSTVRRMSPAHAGLGYIVCSTAMMLGRLFGDPLVRAVGPARIVWIGCTIAAGGFLLSVTVPNAAVSVMGYGLTGLGLANTVPVLFSAAGRQTAMPANLALPAMTTLGYAGNLAGPAAIGLIAHTVGLSASLAFMALLLTAVAVGSLRVRW